jgi:hypothetical protein
MNHSPCARSTKTAMTKTLHVIFGKQSWQAFTRYGLTRYATLIIVLTPFQVIKKEANVEPHGNT